MLRDANIDFLFYIEVANLANNSNMEYTPELIPLRDLYKTPFLNLNNSKS